MRISGTAVLQMNLSVEPQSLFFIIMQKEMKTFVQSKTS